MDKLLYNTLVKYFNTLSYTGYVKDATVFKILVIQFIQELFVNEFKYYITKEDIVLMKELLYQFIGSTCEISFPDYCGCGGQEESGGQGGGDIIPDVPDIPTIVQAYCGWADTVENINVSGESPIEIKNNKFRTIVPPNENVRILWFAIPSDKSLSSVDNLNFAGDDIVGKLGSISNVTIGDIEYKVYYYTYSLSPDDDTMFEVNLN